MSDPSLVKEAQLRAAATQAAEEFSAREYASTARRVWQRVERRRQARRSRRSIVARYVAPALAVAALFVAVSTWWAQDRLEDRLLEVVAQNGLVRTEMEPRALHFADGSSIEMAPQTTLHVEEPRPVQGGAPQRVIARLTRGTLAVHVNPEGGRRWHFYAGPYEIEVVGTIFDMSWDPEGEGLRLRMHKGRVRVYGERQSPRLLDAGQSVTLPPVVEQPVAAAEPAAPAERAEPELAEPTDEDKDKAAPLPAPRAAELHWADLVDEGRFSDVLKAARTLGIDSVLESKGARELRALAQAAHYQGQTDLAVRTWRAVLRRFDGQSEAQRALFFLGRIRDQQGKSGEALSWFERYLTAAPGGVYAGEALGRKLILVRQQRGLPAARVVARDYLRRFPQGTYAETARDMLAAQ